MRLLCVAALAVLLAACAAAPVRPDLTPAQIAAAENAQFVREQTLRTDPSWSLSGRIAVSNRSNGGSGRIEWVQRGANYRIDLRAPVTRQGWRLSSDGQGALLEGLEGGPRRGRDARRLLLRATGWDIPIMALAEWVRGARAPRSFGPARIVYGANGLPWRLEQGGWVIQYEWPSLDDSPSGTDVPLPNRLEASRGEAEVKLIVDESGGA